MNDCFCRYDSIKHTIHGDANITDDVSTIRNLMNMNYDIKR